MTRYLAAALFLALIVLSFYVGRASAAASSRGQNIPAASFVPVRGVAVGEPDSDLGGTSRRPHQAPDSTPAPTRGVPTLAEAKAWARARLSRAEWRCLDAIVRYESHWRLDAVNRSSGAAGLFQALPASKLRWGRDAMGQMRFGFAYAASRYGSFCGGWAHIERVGWW